MMQLGQAAGTAAALAGLTFLDLSAVPVTDLRPLAGLTQLSYLDLGGSDRDSSDLDDLRPLAGLTALTSLEISRCPRLTDLRPLAGLTRLGLLELMDCPQITDLSPLDGLTQLGILDITGCTRVMAAEAARLQARLPECMILSR